MRYWCFAFGLVGLGCTTGGRRAAPALPAPQPSVQLKVNDAPTADAPKGAGAKLGELLGEATRLRRGSQFAEAMRVAVRVLADARAAELHRIEGRALNAIGIIHQNQREYSEALARHQQALVVFRDRLDSVQPETAETYNFVGVTYSWLSRPADALPMYQKSLAGYLATSGEESVGAAIAYGNIGKIYRWQGNYRGAAEMYERAVGIFRLLLNRDSQYSIVSEQCAAGIDVACDVACSAGDGDGCNTLGWVYMNGRTSFRKDPIQAVALFRQGCEKGSPKACNSLGYAHAEGRGGLAVNGETARVLFRDACEEGYAAACDSLGEAHEKGWGTPPNKRRAFEFYSQSCEMGNKVGCANAARMK